MTTTDTLVEHDPLVDNLTTEDPENAAHVVVPKEAVTRAYIEGVAVRALCGYEFVPSMDPNNKSICSKCKEILDEIKAARERGEI